MSTFRMRTTGEILSDAEYRLKFPNISFPPVLTPEDADVIFETPRPNITESQYCTLGNPTQDHLGNWVQTWQIFDIGTDVLVAKFEAEKAAALRKFPRDVDDILLEKIGQRLGEYIRSEADSKSYLAAYELDTNAPVPRKVSGHATANNLTPLAAATDIVTQASQLINVEDTLREVRLLRQYQTRAVVLSSEATGSEVAMAIEQIKSIVHQWNTFINYMRVQLEM